MKIDYVWGLKMPVSHASAVAFALRRITFKEEQTAQPLHRALEVASEAASRTNGAFMIVSGRARRGGTVALKDELLKIA